MKNQILIEQFSYWFYIYLNNISIILESQNFSKYLERKNFQGQQSLYFIYFELAIDIISEKRNFNKTKMFHFLISLYK